jgi:predicted dehydrogenase
MLAVRSNVSANRRTFLVSSAAAAAFAANDTVRAGIIGSGGRGRYLTANFKEVGAEMAAVCDIYEPNLQAGLKAASSGAKPYTNYKKLLEDKSIDAVIVATPDHWHAQMVIDAVEAGKDVYVEKPMAHKIDEGFRVIDAVRRTRRVVQVGMQRRSFDLFQDAKQIMDSGALGDVRLVNAWWVNNQAGLRKGTLQGKLDWQQWLGSAPRRDVDPVRFFNWYYFWDYSGGLMVGQAAHVVDAIHWLMNSTYPLAVTCAGGRPNLEGAEVPETTCMCIEYPENYLAVFTVGYKAMRYASINDQMKQFHGSKARFDVGRESYALYPESNAVDMKPTREVRRPGSFEPATRAHIRNFIECIRSRKDPNATVEMGQYTNVVLCMAMEALRQGRRMRFDAAKRAMV